MISRKKLINIELPIIFTSFELFKVFLTMPHRTGNFPNSIHKHSYISVGQSKLGKLPGNSRCNALQITYTLPVSNKLGLLSNSVPY